LVWFLVKWKKIFFSKILWWTIWHKKILVHTTRQDSYVLNCTQVSTLCTIQSSYIPVRYSKKTLLMYQRWARKCFLKFVNRKIANSWSQIFYDYSANCNAANFKGVPVLPSQIHNFFTLSIRGCNTLFKSSAAFVAKPPKFNRKFGQPNFLKRVNLN